MARYCVYHDISQDFPVRIEEYREDNYCHEDVIEDDGTLLRLLTEARASLRSVERLIEQRLGEKEDSDGC